MFKILFIKPHARRGILQAIEVPLAFLYLSAYLKTYLKTDIAIDLIDLRLEKNPCQALSQKIALFQPDVTGVSILSQDKYFLTDWAVTIKKLWPETKLVIGGPGATYDYDEILCNEQTIDCAVIGEGEKTFFNIVTAIIEKNDIFCVDGIAYFNGEGVVKNKPEPFIEDLDELPVPDYPLVELNRYMRFFQLTHNIVLAEKRYLPVISSRGCPYGCFFCHNIFGKKARRRSPAHFVAEMQMLYDRYDIREFHITDDYFNSDRQRMHEILKLLIKSPMKVKLSFPNGLRSDVLTREDIVLLKKAGTYKLVVAIDSASPRIQKVINKNLDIQKALRSIEYAKEIGIFVRGNFMIGFPGESVEEIEQTIRCALETTLDMASFITVVPFKNTKLRSLADDLYPDFSGYRENVWEKSCFYQSVTGYPLKRTQAIAYLRFYLPFRIIKTFLNMPRKVYGITRWLIWGPQILLPHMFGRR
ncbi:MAG: radical SAM protein [Thermodesulfobacteriota bacterium]|nr:radical SAM protein [Thermodesulfobacteriota bacterium]